MRWPTSAGFTRTSCRRSAIEGADVDEDAVLGQRAGLRRGLAQLGGEDFLRTVRKVRGRRTDVVDDRARPLGARRGSSRS
jgi:hypothetical protein